MVSIEDVCSTVNINFPDRPLVAVLIGATSGIGEYCIRALAKQYAARGSNLRAYIVGRGQQAAKNVIAGCSKLCPGGEFIFVQANDLSIIHDVDRVSAEIIRLERDVHKSSNPRIDLLLMTQGQVIFGPRHETSEGLDKTMALLYYSRIRFITNLMPLLEQAQASSHIISVYAAGLEGKLCREDLSLRNPEHYSFANARSHITYMKTVTFERLAQEHSKLSLVHVFPGIVVTPGYSDPSLPWWFKLVWRIIGPAVVFMKGVSPEDAGQRMLYLATHRFPAKQDSEQFSSDANKGTDGQIGSGAYSVGERSDVVDLEATYAHLRNDGFDEDVWHHTQLAYSSMSKERKFTG